MSVVDAPRADAPRNGVLSELRRARVLYLFVLPAVVYFTLLAYWPVISGAAISFQQFRFVGKSQWIGTANYVRVFITPGFWRAFFNTLILGVSNVVLTAAAPLLLAILVNEVLHKPFRRFLQTILYLPHLFSWVVVGGLWIFILSPNAGLVNEIRALLGLEPVYFMVQGRLARPILVGVNLWKQAGYVMILFLAAIVAIDPQLYEAAMIDGAGGLRRAWHVTVPGLASTLKVVLMLNVMGALRIFDQVFVMRNEVIAPKIDVIMYYVYVRGLQEFDLGYAAAVSVLIFLFTLALTLLTRWAAHYRLV
jgi:putative aldouronate transport system permease protein